jgi:membrane-associated phospholipid phosphatase
MTPVPTLWKARALILILLATLAVSGRSVERLGTSYQYVLPLAALACSVSTGQAADFMIRYGVQLALVHGPKTALAGTRINQRPRGGDFGMPSGHTATATLGASRLVHDCVTGHPVAQFTAILAAGYVGGSRIAVGAHDVWQVILGALVGWTCDRAFRRCTPGVWLLRLRKFFVR